MSNTSIINCKQCHKLFQKTISDNCPTCAETENYQYQQLFRLLQSSKVQGGIFIEDLAEKIGMSVEAIEEYYLEAKLGTAGLFLKFKCRSCSEVVDENHRRGRYCINCSNELSDQAGVKVRSLQDIKREEERAKEIIQLPSEKKRLLKEAETVGTKKVGALKENPLKPSKKPSKRAGFLRNR